jgi:hypothetical protein
MPGEELAKSAHPQNRPWPYQDSYIRSDEHQIQREAHAYVRVNIQIFCRRPFSPVHAGDSHGRLLDRLRPACRAEQ